MAAWRWSGRAGQTSGLRREFYSTRLWLWSMWLGLAAILVEVALRA